MNNNKSIDSLNKIDTVEVKVRKRGKKRHPITHCKYGHEYNDENTYLYPYGRRCKACTLVRTIADRTAC